MTEPESEPSTDQLRAQTRSHCVALGFGSPPPPGPLGPVRPQDISLQPLPLSVIFRPQGPTASQGRVARVPGQSAIRFHASSHVGRVMGAPSSPNFLSHPKSPTLRKNPLLKPTEMEQLWDSNLGRCQVISVNWCSWLPRLRG